MTVSLFHLVASVWVCNKVRAHRRCRCRRLWRCRSNINWQWRQRHTAHTDRAKGFFSSLFCSFLGKFLFFDSERYVCVYVFFSHCLLFYLFVAFVIVNAEHERRFCLTSLVCPIICSSFSLYAPLIHTSCMYRIETKRIRSERKTHPYTGILSILKFLKSIFLI